MFGVTRLIALNENDASRIRIFIRKRAVRAYTPGTYFLFPRCAVTRVPLLFFAGCLIALRLFFAEPEKLQIIQQYLKSSTGKLTGQNVTSGELFTPTIPNDEPNLTISTTGTTSSASTATATTGTTTTTKTSADDAFTVGALLNGEQPFPEIALPSTDAETEAAYQDANATRHCDDCLEGEVCVALVDEEVPICKWPRDREDPTGCAGFCVINKQKCHRLDVDAFRFVDAPLPIYHIESFIYDR